MRRVEKPVPAPFQSYEEYADFLATSAERVAANAADPARTPAYHPVAGLSQGI